MTATSEGIDDRWFSRTAQRPDADVQLFCLPYAGSGASVFRGWSAVFGPRVEVLGVQLPGREARMREPRVIDPARVADAIAAAADRPFGIFGHSMGGRIGFEVIRELRRTGRQLPERFYPSGINPPDLMSVGPFDGLSRLDDEALTARLEAGGGVPAAVLAEPELFELLLPILRSDLTWVDDYTYVEDESLPIPVLAFAGDNDPVAPVDRMAGWAKHTTADYRLHTVSGGHFFLNDHVRTIAGLIEADLLDAVRAR
ncbi:MAG TPA: alpha/beta fold hydrolase [Actinophytocola sp.]|nr:alpha/beta fold hydrolase [Actinophytocola sp.]